MCYLLQGSLNNEAFEDAYYLFKFAKKKLNLREHETKYENMYEQIFEILKDEYNGKNVVARCKSIVDAETTTTFFIPLLNDIINRNCSCETSPYYIDNNFYYAKMNQLHGFFAEFRFWE